VQLLKAGSSKWVNECFPAKERFSWQEGYGAFSVGASQRDKTISYIRRQEEHHKRISFADEFKKLLGSIWDSGRMIQPSLKGLLFCLQGYPALGSARRAAPNHAGLFSRVPLRGTLPK
jgi:hypothetical protein